MRILGIDLGTSGIKAVELDSAFGRYEVHDTHDIRLEGGADPIPALTRFIETLPKKPDRVAVALPTRHVTFRNIRVPTKDRKAIQAGVGYELEDELPFALEKSVYDYSILSQGKQGTEVHVAATLRRHVEQALGTWNSGSVDPDVITSESWAYRAFLNKVISKPEQDEPVLLADIGHERTTLYIHWRGAPVLAREILWGGRDLTQSIALRYNLPPEQAEAAKLDHGFVVPESQRREVTPEQLEFSGVLMKSVRDLLSELRQAELTCKNITHHNLSRVYLSGGTQLLPGLARVIEESLYIPVRPLQALSSIAASGVTYSDSSDACFLLASAIALTQAGPDRGSQINFRKGEFSKRGQAREINLATLRRPLLAAGAIGLSLFVSMLVESSIYRSRIADADAQLERSLKGFFGGISSSAIRTYLSNTSTLKASINKELGKQRELGKVTGPNPRSPLDYLKGLSTSVPKDIVVDMTQFQVGAAPASSYSSTADQTATLSFLVSSPQVAERLAAKLGGLQKGKTEEVTTPEGKKWKITFSGKPAEDYYGK